MLKTKLLPFQLKAVEKLSKIKVGALYMEMGLGKTRTTLELIQIRLDKSKINKVVWFCPCSTKRNLEEQIKLHSNLLEHIEIIGIESISMSDNIYVQAYNIVSNNNCMLVVDESNLVKNHQALRSKRMIELAKFCKYKIILNGTPVTKNEADLFNQWYILDWRILGYLSYYSFSANHLVFDEKTKRITRVLNPEFLTNKIAPYCYQAKKEDVIELPSKINKSFYFDLTTVQLEHYKKIKKQILEKLEDNKNSTLEWIYKLFTSLQLILSGRKITSLYPLKHENFFNNVYENPRIQSLLSIIDEIPDDRKIVLWCKYTEEIVEISHILNEKYGDNVSLLYGELSQKKRNEEIEKFKSSNRFLLGNKNSGGYGLNLQFADYMIFYSNDWDWGTRTQAEDRIHRIGQTNNVTYIDILATDTLDYRIAANLVRKENLSNTLKKLIDKKKDTHFLSKWIDSKEEKVKVQIDRKKIKKYLNNNVLDEAKKRISFIFDEFEHICMSFSGGKDSGVCLNLMIDEARKRGRKFGVMHIDVEAEYQFTSDFIKRMIENNRDVVIPYWICLPMESPNSLSYLDPTWVWWDKEKEPIWVREMPKMDYIINEDNNPIDFYTPKMPFEEFIKHFGTWYGKGEKTAIIVGIRTQESLNRFRAICNSKIHYKDKKYSTNVENEVYNFYPIYDWQVQDIWTYNGKFGKDYNKLYDLFYKAGVPISKMRVDEPFGNESKAGLSLFKVIEPHTWSKVVNRVSGANFGNIYHETKIMKANYTLPKNHTWKSFTKFLLSTLPGPTRAHYLEKFIKFIKYWNKKGSPVSDEMIAELKEKFSSYINVTGEYSNRGLKNKIVVKFRKLPDEIPKLDSKKDFPSWRRLALCLIKNDYVCKTLSFQATKDLVTREGRLIEKYKSL